MCGINGFIYKEKTDNSYLTNNINNMNNLIHHRGPDDDGIFTEVRNGYGITMGMRRLSIIDLHSGKQPIFSEDKQITIVFNGEIYNFLDLKRELLQKGVVFTTNSDTEVILKLYEIEGVSSFKKLDGMFAFSIYDKRKKKIFITRDFFGEKPLYYSNINNQFIWGSELKSIIHKLKSKPKINIKGLNLYFRLTYIPAPYTIYENIHKLEPNHYITYNLIEKEFSIDKIHETTVNDKKSAPTFKEAKKKVKELVYESACPKTKPPLLKRFLLDLKKNPLTKRINQGSLPNK